MFYYDVCSVTDNDFFSDFPGNIWVVSFMVYAFQGSTILQSGIYINNTPVSERTSFPVCLSRVPTKNVA